MSSSRADINKLTAKVGSNRKHKDLDDFARLIERRVKQTYGPMAVGDYVMRLLTHRDPRVSAAMWCKWVEWRYGKPRERVEHSGPDGKPVSINIISYVPRPGDEAEEEVEEPREKDIVAHESNGSLRDKLTTREIILDDNSDEE